MVERVKKAVVILTDAGGVERCYLTVVDAFDKGGGEIVETTPRDVEASAQQVQLIFGQADAVTRASVERLQAANDALTTELAEAQRLLEQKAAANAELDEALAAAKARLREIAAFAGEAGA